MKTKKKKVIKWFLYGEWGNLLCKGSRVECKKALKVLVTYGIAEHKFYLTSNKPTLRRT